MKNFKGHMMCRLIKSESQICWQLTKDQAVIYLIGLHDRKVRWLSKRLPCSSLTVEVILGMEKGLFNFSRLSLKRFFNIHPGNQDQEYHLPPHRKKGTDRPLTWKGWECWLYYLSCMSVRYRIWIPSVCAVWFFVQRPKNMVQKRNPNLPPYLH